MKSCKDCVHSNNSDGGLLFDMKCNKKDKIILFSGCANMCEYYKIKYVIIDYCFMGNSNDVRCYIKSSDDDIGTISILSKRNKVYKHVIKKDVLSKEQVIDLCSFNSQKEELNIKLK